MDMEQAPLKVLGAALEAARAVLIETLGAMIGHAEKNCAESGNLCLPGTAQRVSAAELERALNAAAKAAGSSSGPIVAALVSAAAEAQLSGRALLQALALALELEARGVAAPSTLARSWLLGGDLAAEAMFTTWLLASQPRRSEKQLWQALHEVAGAVLPREHIAPLHERLMTLEELTDVAKLLRLTEVSPLHRAAPEKIVFAKADSEESPETTWVP